MNKESESSLQEALNRFRNFRKHIEKQTFKLNLKVESLKRCLRSEIFSLENQGIRANSVDSYTSCIRVDTDRLG